MGMFSKAEAPEVSRLAEFSAALGHGLCPGLSLKQRFLGSLISLGLAALWFFLAILVLGAGQITTFAMYYTLGNIAAIVCTLFMVGPARQLKLMTRPSRIISLLVFFAMMALTILAASDGSVESIVPCLVFACCQFCAAAFYFLSFIPGGQAGCRFLCSKTTGVDLPHAP